jgi:hypothetical protein
MKSRNARRQRRDVPGSPEKTIIQIIANTMKSIPHDSRVFCACHLTISNHDRSRKRQSWKISTEGGIPLYDLTDAGIHIGFSNGQAASALFSIRVSFDPASKVSDSSDEQDEKHFGPRIVTEAGMRIDLSDMHLKHAFHSICANCEAGSKFNDESEKHESKHPSPRVLTYGGIWIDVSD